MFNPLTAKQLADTYHTNVRQIARWVDGINAVFPNETLKIGAQKFTKYTPFCVQKIDEISTYYQNGKTLGDWKSDQILILETVEKSKETPSVVTEVVSDVAYALAPIQHQEIPVAGKLTLPSLAQSNYNTSALSANNTQNIHQLNNWLGQLQSTVVGNAESMGAAIGASIVQSVINGAAPQIAQLATLMNLQTASNQEKS